MAWLPFQKLFYFSVIIISWPKYFCWIDFFRKHPIFWKSFFLTTCVQKLFLKRKKQEIVSYIHSYPELSPPTNLRRFMVKHRIDTVNLMSNFFFQKANHLDNFFRNCIELNQQPISLSPSRFILIIFQ